MKKILNSLSAILIKSFYEVLRISLLMLAFVTLILLDSEGSHMVDKIILIGYLNYIASATFTFIMRKKGRGIFAPEKSVPIIAIFTILLSIFFLMKSYPITIKMAALIFFPLLWQKGSNYKLEWNEGEQAKRTFLISTGILAFHIFMLFTLDSHLLYHEIINIYFPLYVLVGLMYMNIVNLNSVYGKNYTNAINKDTNISRFNIISATIVIILMGLILTRFLGLWESNFFLDSLRSLRDGFAEVLVIVSYPLGRVIFAFLIRFRRWAQQLNGGDNSQEENLGEESDEFIDEEFMEQEFVMDEGVSTILTYTLWIVLAAIALYTIYKLYKHLKKGFEDEKDGSGNEEREFILSLSDILDGFKKPFTNLFKGMKKSLNNNYFNELHEVRKTYILMVKELINLGFNREDFHTPNEYLSSVERQGYDKSELRLLTKLYNKVRYGNKELSDVEIANIHEIRNKIDSINE